MEKALEIPENLKHETKTLWKP